MSYNKINVSKMTISDFKNIQHSLLTDFDNFWNLSTFENELNNKNSYYLIAKDSINNEILGFIGMKIIIDEADIMNVVTKKNKRNLGIATYMLENLIKIAKEKNIKKLTLEVNTTNVSAIHLYEKFNFKKIAVREKYYNNTDDALIMQKLVF